MFKRTARLARWGIPKREKAKILFLSRVSKKLESSSTGDHRLESRCFFASLLEAVDILKVFVVRALRNKVSPNLCINQFNQFQWLLATSHHWIVRKILTLY